MSNTNLFAVFNDVEAIKAEREKKKSKLAKKKAGREVVSDFDATAPPRTNLEKKMAAKREAEAKQRSKQRAQKKKQAAAATDASKPISTTSIADVCGSWDTAALMEKMEEIEKLYSSKTQEHVQVVKLAEYMEEQFAGVVCDWADGPLSEQAGAEQLALPLSSLPNKSSDAVVKWLRQRGRQAKTGLVAFLLNHSWSTLSHSTRKGSGIGVRMLLQLVAKQDAGCLAANLTMLPIAGMESVVVPGAPKPITALAASHPLSAQMCIWVLHQLTENAGNSRPQTFQGWWRAMLPLLSTGRESADLMLETSQRLFANAAWAKISPEPVDTEAGGWIISPPALRQALAAGLPAEMMQGVLTVVNRQGHATGLFSPQLFAQLLPLAVKASQGDDAAARARHAALPLLLECLVGGGTKVYQNWVATHTSAKATNFAASVEFLIYLSTAPHNRRVDLDRGRLLATVAELKVFHQTHLDEKSYGKWGEAALNKGLRALNKLQDDPTGLHTGSDQGNAFSSAAVMAYGLFSSFFMLSVLVLGILCVLVNTPGLAPTVRELKALTPGGQVESLLVFVQQMQHELSKLMAP